LVARRWAARSAAASSSVGTGWPGIMRAAYPPGVAFVAPRPADYHGGMYLDALEFLEEERDAWAPFEALTALSDDQLGASNDAAHGWSGRDLMGHLLAWQGYALDAARELAVNETSATIARTDADWDARGGEVINQELTDAWAARSMDELRAAFAEQPGELRGYLTVVPETRWIKHADRQTWFRNQTVEHYEEHQADLDAILATASDGGGA
jgi:hypothetical protein